VSHHRVAAAVILEAARFPNTHVGTVEMIGKPVIGLGEERARGFVWDRSADHIRASGQSVALKGRIHDRTRTLR
jgi:hypothetical protein